MDWSRLTRYLRAAERMADRAHCSRLDGNLRRALRRMRAANRLLTWGHRLPQARQPLLRKEAA